MYDELHAAACLDLVLASFIASRCPRFAWQLIDGAAELLYWLGVEPVIAGAAGSACREG